MQHFDTNNFADWANSAGRQEEVGRDLRTLTNIIKFKIIQGYSNQTSKFKTFANAWKPWLQNENRTYQYICEQNKADAPKKPTCVGVKADRCQETLATLEDVQSERYLWALPLLLDAEQGPLQVQPEADLLQRSAWRRVAVKLRYLATETHTSVTAMFLRCVATVRLMHNPIKG